MGGRRAPRDYVAELVARAHEADEAHFFLREASGIHVGICSQTGRLVAIAGCDHRPELPAFFDAVRSRRGIAIALFRDPASGRVAMQAAVGDDGDRPLLVIELEPDENILAGYWRGFHVAQESAGTGRRWQTPGGVEVGAKVEGRRVSLGAGRGAARGALEVNLPTAEQLFKRFLGGGDA